MSKPRISFNEARDELIKLKDLLNPNNPAVDALDIAIKNFNIINASDEREGTWLISSIATPLFTKYVAHCSRCKYPSNDGGNFCSNCGIRMKNPRELELTKIRGPL